MKLHPYKLAGSAIPPELVGRVINVRRAETSEEAQSLCVNGDGGRVITLFNQQNILDQERAGKAVAEGEEVAKLVSSGNGSEAMALIQNAADAYLSGGRAPGVPSETKVRAAKFSEIEARAKADPQLAARLEKLGITF